MILSKQDESMYHSVEIAEILSHTFFTKISWKQMVLLKKLLNRWFDEKFYQWEKISRFSTLCSPNIVKITGKNVVKVMVLLTKLLNGWFDEIFFQWE